MTFLKRNAVITLATIAVIAVIVTGVTTVLPTTSSTHSLKTRSISLPTTTTGNIKKASFENKVPINHASAGLNFVMKGLDEITPQVAQAYANNNVPVKHMTLVAVEKTIQFPTALAGGSDVPTQIMAYTFNGTIPGPTFRVTQGEVIEATLIDPGNNTDNHSIDNHASQITAVPNFTPEDPILDLGHSKTYYFVATTPGFFEYHCEGNVNDLAEHVFRGMQGGVIVDPQNGYTGYKTDQAAPVNATTATSGAVQSVHIGPAAKEVVLDFSEYYLTPNGDFSWQKMFNHNDTFSYINGIPFGYQIVGNSFFPAGSGAPIPSPLNAKPLQFKVGDHVRFFVENTGDFLTNFHIVGEQLDRVNQGGIIENGVQTFNLGGSNTAIIDVTFDQPGLYVIVNHEYSQLHSGQFAIVSVTADGGANPSNAIAPPSDDGLGQTIPQTSAPYTFGTPLSNNCVVKNGPGDDWSISSSCTDQVPVENGGTIDTTN